MMKKKKKELEQKKATTMLNEWPMYAYVSLKKKIRTFTIWFGTKVSVVCRRMRLGYRVPSAIFGRLFRWILI